MAEFTALGASFEKGPKAIVSSDLKTKTLHPDIDAETLCASLGPRHSLSSNAEHGAPTQIPLLGCARGRQEKGLCLLCPLVPVGRGLAEEGLPFRPFLFLCEGLQLLCRQSLRLSGSEPQCRAQGALKSECDRHMIRAGDDVGVCRVDMAGEMVFYLDGIPIDTTDTWRSGKRDWYYHFEGILLGFRADKQNLPGPWNYNWYFQYLNHPRAYGDLRIWSRQLTEKEIANLVRRGEVPRENLVAEWLLDSMPDEYNNYADRIGGIPMHIKEVRTWK